MERTHAESQARDGYDAMAQAYTDHVAKEMTIPSFGRSMLEAFAHKLETSGSGRVADVGCGPGHVTAHLAALGLDIFGVDISPGLLAIATAKHPEVRFEAGQLASLPVATAALQGLVSKHSVIHTPADLIPQVLNEFARVVAPDGLLYLSFFGAEEPGSHGRPFDHAVTTAYELDVDAMATMLTDAGFTEEVRIVRQPKPTDRQLPHGIFFARR